jgi:DHA1 family inner membrane transport protein
MATFAAVPALQIGVVRFGRDAPHLVSTINIGAFNTGNALGAWAGGMVIDTGFNLTRVPLAAAVMALIGLAVVSLNYLFGRAQAVAAAE